MVLPGPLLDNKEVPSGNGDWEKSQNHTSQDPEKRPTDIAPATPEKKDQFLVEFDGPNDPDNPKNWTAKRRWAITISMGLMVFTVTFASSIFSVNLGVVQQKFNVEIVTATLGVALFVLVRQTVLPAISST